MPKPDNVKCENCVYWETRNFGEEGLCRRYPPRPSSEHSKLQALAHIHWALATLANINAADKSRANDEIASEYTESCAPDTLETDWCGEFRSSWPETA